MTTALRTESPKETLVTRASLYFAYPLVIARERPDTHFCERAILRFLYVAQMVSSLAALVIIPIIGLGTTIYAIFSKEHSFCYELGDTLIQPIVIGWIFVASAVGAVYPKYSKEILSL